MEIVTVPRYLIITRRCTPELWRTAVGALTLRFPEVSVESLTTDADGTSRMLCSAPSDEHARRWLMSADIGFDSILPHSHPDYSEPGDEPH